MMPLMISIYFYIQKKIEMGQSKSATTNSAAHFSTGEWEEDIFLTRELVAQDFGVVKAFRNLNDGRILEKYDLLFHSRQEYQFYRESFSWRMKQPMIVQAFHLTSLRDQSYCGTFNSASVYIEHARSRLSDFKDIPHPDNLYCLKSILQGYETIFEKIGGFPVSEEQVCIDSQGKIRVWLNRDLSKNYPEQYLISPLHRSKAEEEDDLITETVSMMIRNTDPECQPNLSFTSFYQGKKPDPKAKSSNHFITFKQIFKIINEYAQIVNSPIPECFTSVLEIFGEQENLYNEEMQEEQKGNPFEISIKEEEIVSQRNEKEKNRKSLRLHNQKNKFPSLKTDKEDDNEVQKQKVPLLNIQNCNSHKQSIFSSRKSYQSYQNGQYGIKYPQNIDKIKKSHANSPIFTLNPHTIRTESQRISNQYYDSYHRLRKRQSSMSKQSVDFPSLEFQKTSLNFNFNLQSSIRHENETFVETGMTNPLGGTKLKFILHKACQEVRQKTRPQTHEPQSNSSNPLLNKSIIKTEFNKSFHEELSGRKNCKEESKFQILETQKYKSMINQKLVQYDFMEKIAYSQELSPDDYEKINPFYNTITTEVELDPEIAQDILRYC